MKPNLILFMLWLVCGICPAATLSVALDGSMQYTVIQEAINASADTDTVLVYPGRYYENIRFNGKNITLASLELTTGNLDYKYSTILDGNQNGSVIQMGNNETNATIRGFTVTNGSGFYDSNYDETYGGGVLIGALNQANSIKIINCVITRNNAGSGGGIQAGRCNLFLSGTIIRENNAGSGGGIKASSSITTQYTTTFDPVNRCSIYNNKAAFGCEMYFYQVNQVHVVVDTFTVMNPSNFYAAAIPANSNIQNPYTFDILHSVHEEVNHDLYVAPWGDDTNDGLSEGTPLKTIFQAVYNIASDPVNPKKVHLGDGLYSYSMNNQRFPLPTKNYTMIVGSSKSNVVLDMESNAIGISSSPYSHDIAIKNLSIVNSKSGISTNRATNFSIDNVDIKSVNNIGFAGGYVGNKSNTQLLSNVMISDVFGSESSYGIDITSFSDMINLSCIEICNLNTQGFQRALNVSSTGTGVVKINGCTIHSNLSNNAEIYNCVVQIAPLNEDSNHQLRIDIRDSAFYNNSQANSNSLGLLHALNGTTTVRNCTFAGNTGGSSALTVKGDAIFENNVFWNPQLPSEVIAYYSASEGISGTVEFDKNCIRNGLGGIYNMSPLNEINWHESNISADPLFQLQGNHPYRLSSGSPLIDAGSHTGLSEQAYDAGGNERLWDGDGDGVAQIDIGAYEYQPIFSPSNLTAVLWQQQIELSWEMPAMDRALSGYRIYRNNLAIGEVSNPGCLNYRDYSTVNDTLIYYVVALYGGVESSASNSVTVIVEGVANADVVMIPAALSLSVSPNPFADLAVIRYILSQPAKVQMQVYNLKGQLVRTLVDDSQGKGEQLTVWEGCDDSGRHLASGIYFLRTKLEGETFATRRLVLLR